MARRLILFLKAPVAGQVKTRLTPFFSPEEARELYIQFVSDILGELSRIELEFYFFYAPSHAGQDICQIFQVPKESCFPQQDGDLGQRMSASFEQLFQKSPEPVVIIGTDSPGLPCGWISSAFQWLENKNIVLGPTFDGGYYLLGMDAFYPSLFRKITWSSATVFSQTLQKIQDQHLSLSLLPPFYDVDYPEDLQFLTNYLQSSQKEGKSIAPRTQALLQTESYLKKLGQLSERLSEKQKS